MSPPLPQKALQEKKKGFCNLQRQKVGALQNPQVGAALCSISLILQRWGRRADPPPPEGKRAPPGPWQWRQAGIGRRGEGRATLKMALGALRGDAALFHRPARAAERPERTPPPSPCAEAAVPVVRNGRRRPRMSKLGLPTDRPPLRHTQHGRRQEPRFLHGRRALGLRRRGLAGGAERTQS